MQNFPKPSILGIGPSVPMGSEPLSVNPPKLADYSSDDGSADDGDPRPLTRDEINSTTPARINRRRKNGNESFIHSKKSPSKGIRLSTRLP